MEKSMNRGRKYMWVKTGLGQDSFTKGVINALQTQVLQSPCTTENLIHFTFQMYMLWQRIQLFLFKISEGLLFYHSNIIYVNQAIPARCFSEAHQHIVLFSWMLLYNCSYYFQARKDIQYVTELLACFISAFPGLFIILICTLKKIISTSYFPKSQPSKVKNKENTFLWY